MDAPPADINFYRYVSNSSTNDRDPLGLWDQPTHDNLIWNALKPCGATNDEIYKIQQASDSFDRSFSSQMPLNSYMHSMRYPFQDEEKAMDERNQFVTQSLTLSMAQYDLGGNWEAPFAQGIHTLTDMTSPEHTSNGTPNAWYLANGWFHGDLPGSGEKWSNMTAQNMQANINMIQAAYKNLTGAQCSCGH